MKKAGRLGRVAALGVFFLLSVEGAKKPKPEPTIPFRKVLGNVSVAVDGGEFLFQDMVLEQDPKIEFSVLLRINGTVINRSSRTWNSIAFSLQFLDVNGSIVEHCPVFYHLAPGASAPFSSIPGGIPIFSFKGTPATWKIEKTSGTFLVDYKISLTKPAGAKALGFEDSAIAIVFARSEKQMEFGLLNKTAAPIRIDWNQVSLVDVTGKSHVITHSGVKLTDREGQKPPTNIPPSARIEDLIVASDSISLGTEKWYTENFLPSGPEGLSLAKKNFSIFMPLEVEGKTVNYNFVFSIDSMTPSPTLP